MKINQKNDLKKLYLHRPRLYTTKVLSVLVGQTDNGFITLMTHFLQGEKNRRISLKTLRTWEEAFIAAHQKANHDIARILSASDYIKREAKIHTLYKRRPFSLTTKRIQKESGCSSQAIADLSYADSSQIVHSNYWERKDTQLCIKKITLLLIKEHQKRIGCLPEEEIKKSSRTINLLDIMKNNFKG